MRKLSTLAILLAASALTVHAQPGRALDWTTYGADAQRTGWEKTDTKFTKDDLAKSFQFLWKVKPQSRKEPHALLPPVIIGNLIGYRGFKELALIASTDDSMHVMDADLNRMYWETRFEASVDKPKDAGCVSGLSAMPSLIALTFRRPAPRPAAAAARSGPPPRPVMNPMYGPRAVYVISGDGRLHKLNVSNGAEITAPVAVLPAYAKTSPLNMSDNVIYATTSAGCGGSKNAVWGVDVSNAESAPVVTSFVSSGGSFLGAGGLAIGADGTVYVQLNEGLLALTPRDLQVKHRFDFAAGGVTPVVFNYKDRDVIVTGGADGRLYLLDSAAPGGSDHKTPLAKSDPVAATAGGLFGGLSSWDQDGTRWVLATVWGPVSADLKIPSDARAGSIVAFRVEEDGGKTVLKPAWVSRGLIKPLPPVIANGVVFALSSGDAASKTRAQLYALDAITGKEMWSTGNQVTAPGSLTGLTIANGRVYFSTNDGTMWVFGMPLEW